MALPNLLAKYSTEPKQSASSDMPDLLSKYGMGSSAQPSAPASIAKPTLPQLMQREAAAKASAAKENSFSGLLKNTVSSIPSTLKTMGTGIKNADIGQTLGNTQLNNTRAGVAVNTVLGLPKAAKETFFPNRGYSDQELANAKPGLPDLLQGLPKVGAEIASSGGQLLNLVPGYTSAAQKFTSTPVGNTLANAGDRVKDYAVPKTAEQAQAMRFADVAGFLPVGSLKNVGTATKLAVDAYKGEKVLTTKLLEDLRGKTTVSKQYILDATNRADLKQPERDLFRKHLETEGDTVNVPQFAAKVKGELLPLKRQTQDPTAHPSGGRYENITLPSELRGPIADYGEHLYESPIKTSAGGVHYNADDFPSYFAHSRVEDLPRHYVNGAWVNAEPTRRVIEIQSDLFQKGRLENEIGNAKRYNPDASISPSQHVENRTAEIAKLEPYRNTWHERVIREEVKKAAQDGKTKLQFPTGETAMKIEGLGENASWADISHHVDGDEAIIAGPSDTLNPDQLKVGQRVASVDEGIGSFDPNESWIITDVLGGGKFKAVSKHTLDGFLSPDGQRYPKQLENALQHLKETNQTETFDISGKVDSNNPIYRFYEKEVGKYLSNKYGAKRVTDAQGVSWWEIPVNKGMKDAPIEAFGAAAGGQDTDGDGQIDSIDPLTAGLGILGIRGLKKLKGGVHGKPNSKIGTDAQPLDRLIAEGKIRVTRRGEYDIFQVQKGGEWKNARDQYSAIAQVTKEPLLKPKVEASRKKEPLLQRPPQSTPSPSSSHGTNDRSLYLKIEPATKSMSEGEARSLEIVQQQQGQGPTQGTRGGDSSLEEMIKKIPTPVKKKVNILDYIRTPDRVLNKIGLGKEAEMLHEHYDEYLKELPKNIDKITEWSKQVGKPSNERIFKYLDGGAIDLAPNELKVAHEIRNWLMNWSDRLHLPKNKQISHYITHLFDDQLIAKEFDEDLAKIIVDKIPGSVYDPFLEKRLGIQGYKRDTWAALDAYAKRATRKVHMDPVLAKLEEASGTLEESQWKYIKRYADRVNLRPTELDNLLDNGMKAVIGYRLGGRPTARVTQMFRRVAYRAMLGLNPGSALRNLSQGANTYAKLGEKYTAIGYGKLFSKTAREELVREGVLDNGFIQDRALSSTKKVMEMADKGLFAFFDTAEKINRGAAYLGAKARAISMGKTEAEAVQLAKKLVRTTQFSFGSVDTPVSMSSDIVKTLTQFQSYTTKQIEFLAEMAKNKEFAGLIRYGVAGTVFVYTVGRAFGMEPKELLPIYRLGTPPSLKVPLEVGKGALNIPDQYGNTPSLEKKVQNVGNAVLTGMVPGGTQIKKTIQGLDAVNKGAAVNSAGKINYQVGGTPLKDAQSVVFGKYSSQEAKDYYNDVKSPEEVKTRKIYDQAQKLKEQGKITEANALWDTLSVSEKKIYKYMKSAAKSKATQATETKLMPLYWRLQQMKKDGRGDEANMIYNALSKDEKHAYTLLKNKLK